jgi:hypothetical protein
VPISKSRALMMSPSVVTVVVGSSGEETLVREPLSTARRCQTRSRQRQGKAWLTTLPPEPPCRAQADDLALSTQKGLGDARSGTGALSCTVLSCAAWSRSLCTHQSVLMRPILLAENSVNQTLSPRPDAMPKGALEAVGTGNSVMAPLVVMRSILFPPRSVNQRLPSGPSVMPRGAQLNNGGVGQVVGSGYQSLSQGALGREGHSCCTEEA